MELNIIQAEYCSEDEEKIFVKLEKEKQPLPEGIYVDNTNRTHFRCIKTDVTEDEIKKLYLFRQTKYLRSIKNSMIFFVVLSIISLFFYILVASNIVK